MIDVRVDPQTQRQLQIVAAQLRRNGSAGEIRKEMIKGLRAAAKPAEKAVKSAAMGLPATTGQSTGLRRRIAGATGTQVRTGGRTAGVKIRVARKRMGGQATLPTRMNRPGEWRHPVWGNREVWVTQSSRAGWFDDSARSTRAQAMREMGKVLVAIGKRLSR